MERVHASVRVERPYGDVSAWLRVFVPAAFPLRLSLRVGSTPDRAGRFTGEHNVAVRLRRRGERVSVNWGPIGSAATGEFDGLLALEPLGQRGALLALEGEWSGEGIGGNPSRLGADVLCALRERLGGTSAP